MVTIMLVVFGAGTLAFIVGVLSTFDCECSCPGKMKGFVSFLVSFIAFLLLLLMAIDHMGYSRTNISAGTYRVISVMPNGSRINLVAVSDSGSDPILYEFPKEAFTCTIDKDAKTLKVTEVDGFKKLDLIPEVSKLTQ